MAGDWNILLCLFFNLEWMSSHRWFPVRKEQLIAHDKCDSTNYKTRASHPSLAIAHFLVLQIGRISFLSNYGENIYNVRIASVLHVCS